MSYAALSLIMIISTLLITTRAANFQVQNKCSYVVWAAASTGGGLQLNPNEVWSLEIAPGTNEARIWGRTSCNFDGSGCETGDCGGQLECTGYGNPPNTVANFQLNYQENVDFYSISLLDGFNIPMEFGPTNNEVGACTPISCTADIIGQCPSPLQSPGGCNNPCTVFKTNEYCCFEGPCGLNDYIRFFKDSCPTSYVYTDDPSGTFTCPAGTNYKVVFCP